MTSQGDSSVRRRMAALGRQHPALVLTGGYLAATAMGMLSSWTFYRRFGINIFQYAQLSDFVLISLRNPLAAVAILAAVPVVWAIIKSDEFLDRRIRWYKYIYGPKRLRALSRTPAAWLLYIAAYAYALSLLYSNRLVDQVRGGDVGMVEVQLQSGRYLGRDGSQPFPAIVLGTTTDYVFLYDVPTRTVTIVPLENLASLTLELR